MSLREEYPRPQFRREEWLPLNGAWEFAFDDEGAGYKKGYPSGEVSLPRTIEVPFSYQYPLSGIGDAAVHDTVWYKRTFSPRADRRALLCFNGADYQTDVWVNGRHVISHTGGHAPFYADITDCLRADENVLVVRCFDPIDAANPRGKQSWTGERFGCWYLPNTGIWKSVWIDYFREDCIARHSLMPDFDGNSIFGDIVTLRGIADEAEIEIAFDGALVKRARFSLDGRRTDYRIQLPVQDLVGTSYAWTPEHPNLFSAVFRLYANGTVLDEAHTRFGMKKIHTENGKIFLNNKPFYQRLILDQGYWQESGLTPPGAEALKRDILLAKAMGFNGARKHQKWEDPYFYYYAEELGFAVWCEMPSAYKFCGEETEKLLTEWQEIVLDARNFTSVCCLVPLNESWGAPEIAVDGRQQSLARAMYHAAKTLCDLPVSSNDGWETVSQTDLLGIHDYAYDGGGFSVYRRENASSLAPQGRRLLCDRNEYRGQPLLLTEFGGIAMTGDILGGNWGYNKGAENVQDFYQRYENLLKGIYENGDIEGFCYTQLTDVQQEVNGLLFADRTPKFDVAKLKELTEGRK